MNNIKELTCSKYGEMKDTFSEIVESQGQRVCLSCKEENKESDKRAFDRDIIIFRN